ncbi:unnamed protein product [Anisakis simplex]|uniref:P4Hc domain-containing protein n=1 Tax=Anisakis simplex TaxID=6269 RepID=A0A0M3JWQ9_ANISI|nr:unnamed protein product [Anisakis simplex]
MEDNAVEVNPLYLTDDFCKNFRETIAGSTPASKPFPHWSLENFISNEEFVRSLRKELKELKWKRKENDLYSITQTDDLANVTDNKYRNVIKYREFVKDTMRNWLMRASGISLNQQVDLTGSSYKYTDVLLPHDDQLEKRKFAFVLYLCDESWKEQHGGQLKLYRCDDSDNPLSVHREIYPKFNMMNIFEVSKRSWHMVSEVVTKGVDRLSINGWFHADDVPTILPLNAVRREVALPHMDITLQLDEVTEWINPSYILPAEQEALRANFEEESQICLTRFIRREKHDQLMSALAACQFHKEGPPSKREVWYLDETHVEKTSIVGSLLRLFRSRAITLLASQWTGLKLEQLADESTPEDKELSGVSQIPNIKRPRLDESNFEVEEPVNSEPSKGKVSVKIKKFKQGCYTLADDQLALESSGYILDLQLFLSDDQWDAEAGGFMSYIAKYDRREELRVNVEDNSLAVVYREPHVFPIMKYVNDRAGKKFFYVLDCTVVDVPGDETDLNTPNSSSSSDSSEEDSDGCNAPTSEEG